MRYLQPLRKVIHVHTNITTPLKHFLILIYFPVSTSIKLVNVAIRTNNKNMASKLEPFITPGRWSMD